MAGVNTTSTAYPLPIPPPYAIFFGPGANCTLEICAADYSVYGYQPSLGANVAFMALYALTATVHLYLGVRWRTWFFTTAMVAGSLSAIVGYAGRVMLHYNPWSFAGFLIQIICVGSAPVYFTASIYVTLSFAIKYLSPSLSRFNPDLFFWIFIPTDMLCLVLQASGGALSTVSSGDSRVGVDLTLAGLSLQVIFMGVFAAFFADYLARYFRSDIYRHPQQSQSQSQSQSQDVLADRGGRFGFRSKLFLNFMALAFLIILARCAYRVVELREGYSGRIFKDEGLFIGLEGVLILLSVICLMIGHPGFALKERRGDRPATSQGDVVGGSATQSVEEKV
ncbi:parasitic phase-specific protein PSP-1 [Podospora appendiculata]|uniref:Parasitic phase-specific protein PSP-1 n=1 Tax=Podospora appendiculata TaxID=314037 RepID=A0AAE1CCM8_9PEZI|nr:parasitic phase-specific protein PSP-1 [Podospora appendiculata]